MFRRWTFGQVLFVFLAAGFLVTGFWGVAQSRSFLDRQPPGGGHTESTFTITVSECPSAWRPVGGPNGGSSSDAVNLTVTVSPSPGSRTFTCSLSGVSTWEGYCMNDGTQTDSSADLEFNSQDNPGWTCQGTTMSGTASSPFNIRVRPLDYGAYGNLTVSFYYGGQLFTSNTIRIPRDVNNNKIADGWRNDNATSYNESADSETGPGESNTHDGDGFSVFEEYRGFKVWDTWTDLDPSKKEVFVYVDASLPGLGYAATNLNSNTSGVVIPKRIKWDEMLYPATVYIVNHKGVDVPGHVNRRALKVLVNNTAEEGWGFTPPRQGQSENPLYPNKVQACFIYKKHIEDVYGAQATEVKNRVIGHEVGHGINLDHCGDSQCIINDDGNPLDDGTIYKDHHYPEYMFREDPQ